MKFRVNLHEKRENRINAIINGFTTQAGGRRRYLVHCISKRCRCLANGPFRNDNRQSHVLNTKEQTRKCKGWI